MIRAVVVEDEPRGRDVLIQLLADHCPDVRIVGIADTPERALEVIRAESPDLVFLDIEMPRGTGFDVLESRDRPEFEVIFTTAHDEHAIRAIRASALDYLLKPIDPEELQRAVDRYRQHRDDGGRDGRVAALLHELRSGRADGRRLALTAASGVTFVDLEEIVSCEAQSNYTAFELTTGARVVVSRTLRFYEQLLDGDGFFRVHHGHLVNLRHVKEIQRGRQLEITLSGGRQVPVSRRRRDDLLAALAERSIGLDPE